VINIIDSETVIIVCPECSEIQKAEVHQYAGAPFWARAHTCINCNYIVMESEWQEATPEQVEIYALRQQVRILTAVAEAAWELPIDFKVGESFARAMMTAVHVGAFVPEVEG